MSHCVIPSPDEFLVFQTVVCFVSYAVVTVRFGLLVPGKRLVGKKGFLQQSSDWLERLSPK